MQVRVLAKVSGVVVAGALALGCASAVDVTQAYKPKDAASISRDRMEPVAVMRGQERIPVPANARVEADRIVLDAQHVHKLAPTDVIEKDEGGRIVAVRTASDPPVHIRFVPGTAVSPEDSDEVRGQLEGKDASIALQPTDRVVMHGSFAPDEKIPGGGHVETSRSTGLLVTGVALLALSYAPTAYAGIASGRSGDRVLLAPIVGPWIDLAGRPGCVSPQNSPVDLCIEETASRVALYISGGVQVLGAFIGAFGLPTRSQVVYADHGVAAAKPTFHIVPFSTGRGGGAAAFGTF